MTIKELENYPLNPALAYTLGLIFPLYKEKSLDGKDYILGSVNHNPGMVTLTQINEHYKFIEDLITKYMDKNALQLKTNKCDSYTISPKEGFSIIIDKSGLTRDETLDILTKKVIEITNQTNELKKEFIKGCFDGRSSWDKTAHFLSIDIDRDYNRQDIIIGLLDEKGIKYNVNRRDLNHSKNDQLRIKFDSIPLFMSIIGLYSTCRTQILNDAIMKLL